MIGVRRYLYNAYLSKNQELYNLYKERKIDKSQAFMSAIDFDKYINNDVKIQDEFKWIDETCSMRNIDHKAIHLLGGGSSQLSDRVYICPKFGTVIDRDYNASLNLRDAKLYKIA